MKAITVGFRLGVTLLGITAVMQSDVAAADLEPLLARRVEPIVPAAAVRAGKFGTVEVEMTVQANGTVVDPVIVNEQLPGVFGAAALDAVRQWHYFPALRDGQQVDTPHVTAVLRVGVEPDPLQAIKDAYDPYKIKSDTNKDVYYGENAHVIVNPAFQDKYREIADLLKAGDFAGARAVMPRLNALVYYPHEVDSQRYLNASIAFGLKEYGVALPDLVALTAEGTKLPKGALRNSLSMQYYCEIALYHLVEALATYERLNGLKRLQPQDPMVKSEADVRLLLAADTPLRVPGEITGQGFRYRLARRIVGVSDVTGELDQVAFMCDSKIVFMSFQPDSEWNIPASWGQCDMQLRGSIGTRFYIMEFKSPVG